MTKKTVLQKTTHRDVKHVFTKEERVEISNQMAQAIHEAEKAEIAKKDASNQFKSQIDRAIGEARLLSEQLRSGYEFRDMECDVVYDFSAGRVNIYHPETMDVVESRAITDDERQMTLDEAEVNNGEGA